MKLVDTSISIDELKNIAETSFGDFVKAVVDVKLESMVVDAELQLLCSTMIFVTTQ